MYSQPLAYFITIRCYGTWLHGDERGSIDRRLRRGWGDPVIPHTPALERSDRARLAHQPIELSPSAREVVERVICEVCETRRWNLRATNARSNHVHVVVTAPHCSPERVMNTLKSWCTRGLITAGQIEQGQRVWSRHGSTIYLWKPESVDAKVHYVLNGQ